MADKYLACVVDTDLLDEILLCPVQFIHIAINVMEGHALVETALQIAYLASLLIGSHSLAIASSRSSPSSMRSNPIES